MLVGAIRDATKSNTFALLMLSASCMVAALITILFFRQRQHSSAQLRG